MTGVYIRQAAVAGIVWPAAEKLIVCLLQESPLLLAMAETKTLIRVATATSGVALLFLVTIMALIAHDITAFHEDALANLEDFKLNANGAWQEMMEAGVATRVAVVPSHASRTLFKRAATAGSCGCGAAPNDCPAGPPGPSGEPGRAGEDGKDGDSGKDGMRGVSSGGAGYDAQGCVSCPAGPPGSPGPDGVPGDAGADGSEGQPGDAGKDGEDGAPGEPGNQGQNGLPGSDGHPGQKGHDGKRGKGTPGRAGQAGAAGRAGRPGARGQNGARGAPGAEGEAGAPGHEGAPGDAGAPGGGGEAGLPGADASYCPCPPRTMNGPHMPSLQPTTAHPTPAPYKKARHLVYSQ